MLSLALAGVMLYGYLRYLDRSPSAFVGVVAICAALLNPQAQTILPGARGVGASLAVAVIVVFGFTKGIDMKRLTVILLFAVLSLGLPMPVMAAPCEGFLCNLFGSFERQQMRNEKQVELARIEQARQAEVARIEGEAAAKVEEAKAQLAREVAAGQIAQAEADRQARAFEALVNATTTQATRQIELEYQGQAELIMRQTEIALAGVRETGTTERWRIATSAGISVVSVLMIGAIVLFFMRRQGPQPQPPVLVLPPGHQWPGLAQRGDVYELPGTVDVEHPPVRWGGER